MTAFSFPPNASNCNFRTMTIYNFRSVISSHFQNASNYTFIKCWQSHFSEMPAPIIVWHVINYTFLKCKHVKMSDMLSIVLSGMPASYSKWLSVVVFWNASNVHFLKCKQCSFSEIPAIIAFQNVTSSNFRIASNFMIIRNASNYSFPKC